MDEETMLATNTLFLIADVITVPVQKESKFQWEFQELCSQLQTIYGKAVWTLPYKYSESKIKRAHGISEKKGIKSIAYLIGIIKRDRGF